MTKNHTKLLATLRKGRELTVEQVQAFGFSSARAAVRTLREKEMVSIYANNRNGVTKYRIGMPTQALQAAGFTA